MIRSTFCTDSGMSTNDTNPIGMRILWEKFRRAVGKVGAIVALSALPVHAAFAQISDVEADQSKQDNSDGVIFAPDDDVCFVITGPSRYGFRSHLVILADKEQIESLSAKKYEPISCRGFEQAVTEVADTICVFDKDAKSEIKDSYEKIYGVSASELCKITGNKKLKARRQNSYEDWLEKSMR